MNITKKSAAAIVAAIVIVAALSVYVVSSSSTAEGKVVKIAVADKSCYEPWWVADSLGLFEEESVSVEYMVVGGGGLAASALLSGQVDLAGMGADPMIRVFNTSDGYKTVTRWQLGESFTEYAVRKDANIDLNDPTTLLGKKMGMDTTTAYYSAYLSYLTRCVEDGLITQGQMDTLVDSIVHTEFYAMAAALIQGSLDILSGGSYNSVAIAQGAGAIEMQRSPSEYAQPFSICLLASDSAMNEKSDEIVKVLKALQRACDYINDPDTFVDACEIVVGVYGGTWTVEQQKEYYNASVWQLGFNASDVQCLQFVSDLLFPDANVDVADRFEPKFLKEIMGDEFTWPAS